VAILPAVQPGSLEWFRWFYAGRLDRPGEMEERWHPDLVINQSEEFPDTQGTFRGYEGISAMNRELQESLEYVIWEPVAVEPLGGERYLVTVKTVGKGRGSGIELEGDIGHIVTLRDGRAQQLDTYLSLDAARAAAALD
jgi:ketosteroid isomerase-like protein